MEFKGYWFTKIFIIEILESRKEYFKDIFQILKVFSEAIRKLFTAIFENIKLKVLLI